jgi:hypothetical protein
VTFQASATGTANLVEQQRGLLPGITTVYITTPGVTFRRVYAAARSRAIGPTTALWHAVELYRPAAELDDASELTVCRVLARIASREPWPPQARDVCPICVGLTR